MHTIIRNIFTLILTGIILYSCQKDNTAAVPTLPANFQLSYGDSILYLRSAAGDYIVSPKSPEKGQYFGFPEGIELDPQTGAVNVSKSETGLRYKISFVPEGRTDTFSTILTISGINFLDGFYRLAAGDSILHPLYDGYKDKVIPGLNNGSVFDEGAGCNSQGCTVNVIDGEINLAQTVRNGVFGSVPSNNDRHEFQLKYRISDNSGKAANALNVKLYYFDTMSDVTQEAYDIIASREGTILGSVLHPVWVLHPNTISSVTVTGPGGAKPAKPRPPCIFIISR